MDDRVFLAWNLPNWITVVLMVALGYLAVGLLTQVLMRRQSFAGFSFPGFGAAKSIMPAANDLAPGAYPGSSNAGMVYGGGSYAGFGA